MTAPKHGDRVRVIAEALWTGDYDPSAAIWVDAEDVVSIEVLGPPEPDWQPGDVVKTNIHFPFLRGLDDTWKVPGSGPDPAAAAQIVSKAWAAGKLTVLHGTGAAR